MGFQVVVRQISILAVMILLGFVAVKTKYVNAELKNGISKVVLRFTLPLLNLTAISGQTLSPELLKNAGLMIVIELLTFGVLLGFGLLSAKLFRLPSPTRTMHTCMSVFGNVIFLGYPLITALYGQEGLFYAIVYALVNDGVVWTLGVYLIAKSGKGNSHNAVKNLINPNTIAFVIALLMLAFGLRLPSLLHESLSTVGSMTTPLAMLFIGMTLATINLKGIYKRVSIYLIVLFKMLFVPAMLALLLCRLSLDKALLGVLIMQAAMPAQTVLTIVANEYGGDYQYATECVFIMTVLSLLSLPAIYWFLLQIF